MSIQKKFNTLMNLMIQFETIPLMIDDKIVECKYNKVEGHHYKNGMVCFSSGCCCDFRVWTLAGGNICVEENIVVTRDNDKDDWKLSHHQGWHGVDLMKFGESMEHIIEYMQYFVKNKDRC